MSAALKNNPMFLGPLQKLNPICVSSKLQVERRLRRAPLEFETRHPIILLSDSHVTKLFIEQHHRDSRHCCLSFTWT